jgi:hypothetical protein
MKARKRGLCMLTNGSAVPCMRRTGQLMRSSRVGTSNMDARTVSRYPGTRRSAQPVGSDRDDRKDTAPRGELECDPGTERIPGDVELGHAKPVHRLFNGICQRGRVRRDPWRERG